LNDIITVTVTLNDFEGHFCCLKPSYLPPLGNIACIIYDMFTHESESAYGV